MSGPDESPSPIRAVLYDFGGVFVPSPFEAGSALAGRLGVGTEQLNERVFGPYHLDTDHPWHRLERGEISFDVARHEIMAMGTLGSEESFDPMTLLAEMASTGLVVRDFMVETVRRVRARGVRTAVVTNNLAEFGSAWRGLLDVDSLFDTVVDSSEVGVRKPDPAIYALACDRLEVDPTDAVFIDDHQGNIDGARAVGIRTVFAGVTEDSARLAADELMRLVLR